MGYCPYRREGHMRCGTRDGRTLSRRRRLDPRLLVVRSTPRHDRTWVARNGVKAARGAVFSARSGCPRLTIGSRAARVEQVSRKRILSYGTPSSAGQPAIRIARHVVELRQARQASGDRRR
jgi:hypothetical protein